MDFSKINAISKGLPLVKTAELDKNRKYKVTKIRKANTMYGLKFIVELDSEIQCFLPNRISEGILNDGEIFANLKKAVESKELYLKYVNACIEFCS